ncbi:hypothetical protein B7495_18565 (plasmid) [Cryobacterium sp. LW097]|uniref:hypothetical protein n=1 Tax=unclassified Cryobacterium TaxID=2649013 RepID=UPI000B4D4EE5|nr:MULTISPECIES: hypothetical protein [unclassified Cryobacterium]ASD24279.1 hypothetical protein B7495_18565 [Cryobacterium sp. LW097]TFC52852.1 hypothetical protein E3O68_13220 [Cryobacterium sp. TMB3-1-2]TFC62207.1 hypothetical protein E3O60_02670 [Cryobacterium sp. TMB1-7]TFC70702.1 hypothetical protein E3T21_09835 [Cryobacterium sp. TMB3-15]TFC75428.1 hypothetical protein E3T22_12405 [Cryobacterium sp. TMB3-10]
MALATLAVVGALLLSGCSGGRGADAETTQTRLLTYPGIAASRVVVGDSMSGFTVSRYVSLSVTLKPGFVVGDADALADWLFRTAWSVNDKKLDGALVSVQAANGDPVAWDYWPAALEQFGLPQSDDPAASRSDYEVTGIVDATAEELESVIGPWPADIPEPTDDLIVTG